MNSPLVMLDNISWLELNTSSKMAPNTRHSASSILAQDRFSAEGGCLGSRRPITITPMDQFTATRALLVGTAWSQAAMLREMNSATTIQLATLSSHEMNDCSWPLEATSNSIPVPGNGLKLSLRQACLPPKFKKILQCFGSSATIHRMQDAYGRSYFQNVRLVRLVSSFNCSPETYTLGDDFLSRRRTGDVSIRHRCR
ncbi:hypothetical protein JAB8_04800 [Janthinobacterium sp. HH106]|nr:hypothetical protein JAB8_04800 [Janthinobacterium sp. HH106]